MQMVLSVLQASDEVNVMIGTRYHYLTFMW